jgi:hypothetical protein
VGDGGGYSYDASVRFTPGRTSSHSGHRDFIQGDDMKMPKVKFSEKKATPEPKIIISRAPFHLMQEMKVGINQETGLPFYVLKFEFVTDENGKQAILSCVKSDGAIIAQVLDGNEDKNHDQPE